MSGQTGAPAVQGIRANDNTGVIPSGSRVGGTVGRDQLRAEKRVPAAFAALARHRRGRWPRRGRRRARGDRHRRAPRCRSVGPSLSVGRANAAAGEFPRSRAGWSGDDSGPWESGADHLADTAIHELPRPVVGQFVIVVPGWLKPSASGLPVLGGQVRAGVGSPCALCYYQAPSSRLGGCRPRAGSASQRSSPHETDDMSDLDGHVTAVVTNAGYRGDPVRRALNLRPGKAMVIG
jgi:hypothetical protein